MSDTQALPAVSIAASELGECRACRAPVSSDQRYCLRCGARQQEPRVPFAELLAGQGGRPGSRPDEGWGGPVATTAGADLRDSTPLIALGGLALLALVLVVGVLIGRDSGSSLKQATPSPAVAIPGGPGAAAATTAGTATTVGGVSASPTTVPTTPSSGVAGAPVAPISESWPLNLSGYSVQLQLLPAATATSAGIAAAESAARAQGASLVGVLNAANHRVGSGYVVYSGSYSSKAQADASLARLRKSFPAAKVIYVRRSNSGSVSPITTTKAPK